MKVHYLQHVPFEALGSIKPYLLERGHDLSSTHLYLGEALPEVQDVDALIVMGGPMGVHDDSKHPWLAAEKKFIKDVIDDGKTVLGVCLGAQLIADVLGAKVYAGVHREIGWFDVETSPEFGLTKFAFAFPARFEAFHWHGDTFEIPESAVALGASEACKHQGFIFNHRVVALQFHLETTPESAAALIAECGDELDGSMYACPAAEMLADKQRFDALNKNMALLLQVLEL